MLLSTVHTVIWSYWKEYYDALVYYCSCLSLRHYGPCCTSDLRYNILAAGAGSYTSHIESGDYKATSCQNNKPDTLSSSHVWLAGTCFSWNESRSVGSQHPSQSSLIKTSQETLCCVSDRETKPSGGVGPGSKGGRTEQKVSPPAWSATNAFCTPMTPQRRESSLIHVCCTSKCGLD